MSVPRIRPRSCKRNRGFAEAHTIGAYHSSMIIDLTQLRTGCRRSDIFSYMGVECVFARIGSILFLGLSGCGRAALELWNSGHTLRGPVNGFEHSNSEFRNKNPGPRRLIPDEHLPLP